MKFVLLNIDSSSPDKQHRWKKAHFISKKYAKGTNPSNVLTVGSISWKMHEALLAVWMLEKGRSCTTADICYWAVGAPICDPLCCHSAEVFKTMWRELRGQLNPGQGWLTIHCNDTTTRNAAARGCACSLTRVQQNLQSCLSAGEITLVSLLSGTLWWMPR